MGEAMISDDDIEMCAEALVVMLGKDARVRVTSAMLLASPWGTGA